MHHQPLAVVFFPGSSVPAPRIVRITKVANPSLMQTEVWPPSASSSETHIVEFIEHEPPLHIPQIHTFHAQRTLAMLLQPRVAS